MKPYTFISPKIMLAYNVALHEIWENIPGNVQACYCY